MAPGRRIQNFTSLRKLRPELDGILDRKMARGGTAVWWGRGVFVRHIALGLLEPISLCARYVGQVSSAPMPTLIGVTCRTCESIWNAAITRNNLLVETANEKAICELADELDHLIGAGETIAVITRWHELYDERELRTAVRARLDERGVDLQAVLDGNGPKRFNHTTKRSTS
jgi:hypothetical protein